MGVYFGRLFSLLVKRNITQETLCRACNISTKTLAGMKVGRMPSMEVIDKLCNYLNCDFNDIMEHIKDDDIDPLVDKQLEDTLTEICSIYRVALKEYMENTSLSIEEVCNLSCLSINTVKSLLVGKIISNKSCIALYSISKEFGELVDEKMRLFQEGIPLENSAVLVAKNKIEKFAGNSEVVRLLKDAVTDYISERGLDKKAFCSEIEISIVTFNNLMENKIGSYVVLRKILDKLPDAIVIEIAEQIDGEKPISSLSKRFRPKNCNQCPAFDKENQECRLLYKIVQKDEGLYYSAEPCSKPKSYADVGREGVARGIEFKKPSGVIYRSAKMNRWDEN